MDDDEAVESAADREAASDVNGEPDPMDVESADDTDSHDSLGSDHPTQTSTGANRDGDGLGRTAPGSGSSDGGIDSEVDETDIETDVNDIETDVNDTKTGVNDIEADEPNDGPEGIGAEGDESDGAVAPTERDESTVDGEDHTESGSDGGGPMPGVPDPDRTVPDDVQKYARFKKMDGAQYDRVNEFLRDRTYITAREWAIARLCADFRTETGVEMTKIGENLPELIPFMTDTYTPQAVNQARSSFDGKVRKAGATFLYGAMCDFYTAEELDDVMYEVTEVAKFLLEVEGVDLSVEDELEAEERISSVMREVREASKELREQEDAE